MAIIRYGTLAFTRSISAGGEALSRALSQGSGLKSIRQKNLKEHMVWKKTSWKEK